MTHDELVERAARWLKSKGCSLVFQEMVTLQSETPDAIGWRDSGATSYLVECKASRSDFHADKNKSFRRGDVPALGRYRYYLCPPGMIRPEDLPPRWGLLYCHPSKIELVAGRDPRSYDGVRAAQYEHQVNAHGELRMLHSALNRLKIDLGEGDFYGRVLMPYAERKRLKPEAFNRGASVTAAEVLA